MRISSVKIIVGDVILQPPRHLLPLRLHSIPSELVHFACQLGLVDIEGSHLQLTLVGRVWRVAVKAPGAL